METLKKNYIIVIIVAAIIVFSGFYLYNQNLKAQREEELTQQEEERVEALRQAKYDRWEDWSRTLYVGTNVVDFHPGINVGRGGATNSISIYGRGGKLLWVDKDDWSIFNPGIAESWEWKQNAAGEAYIEYKIKEGLKFPDGTTVNAAAVKYSWEQEYFELPEREIHQDTYHLYTHEMGWKRLEVPDELTLWQFLPENAQTYIPLPFAFMYALPHATIVSPTSTEQYAKESNDIEDFLNQVGYGPWLLESFEMGVGYTMIPFDDYPVNPLGGYAGPTKVTKLDRLVVKIYGDPMSMRMALETGEIDVAAWKLSRADIVDLQDSSDITINIAEELGWTMILRMSYYPEFAPLNDTRVRRAILHVVDPDPIVEKVLYGTGIVANTPVHTFNPYFYPEPLAEIRALPSAERIAIAKELMIEAGYPDGFTTQIFYDGADETRETATILQQQLAQIGITLEIKLVEAGVYREMYRGGQCPMYLSGWSPDYNDPDAELWYLLRHEHLYSDDGYYDLEMDALLELGKNLYNPLGDPPEREGVYKEIQQKIVDEAIDIVLYYDSSWMAQRNWVKGYEPWLTTARIYLGTWNAYKDIPADWETSEPPL